MDGDYFTILGMPLFGNMNPAGPGVWVGNADSSPLAEKAEALTIASPVWKDYMIHAHKLLKEPKVAFDIPPGLVQAQISTLSGELPTACTPIDRRHPDIFFQEHAPTLEDPACEQLVVDKVTHLLASDDCPAEATEQGSFFNPEGVAAEAADHLWTTTLPTSGTGFSLPLAPTEKCSLALTPGRMDRPTVSILFPTNSGVAPYPSFQPKLDWHVGSHIREIRALIDGKEAGSVTEAPFHLMLRTPRSIARSGTHTLKITVVDEYFNEASDEVSFTFGSDSSGPSVELTSPPKGASVKAGAPLTISATASDTEGGVKYVEFFLDEQLLTIKPQEPYTLTYPDKLSSGTHTVKATATDFANNKSSDEAVITVTPRRFCAQQSSVDSVQIGFSLPKEIVSMRAEPRPAATKPMLPSTSA